MEIIDSILDKSRSLLYDFSRILFPECCPVCHTPLVAGERLLCMECLAKMPRTHYHLSTDNPLHYKLVDIKAPVEKAASFFFYKNDSPYSRLLRDAKYNGMPAINRSLAYLYALELRPTGFFDDIDLLIAVPIHWLKSLRRGYNQSEHIARGLSEVTGIPVASNLRACKSHTTQTRKKARERRKALPGIFTVDNPGQLAEKHILLIDDIITTGATVASCLAALQRDIPGVRLSVLSLASTKFGR